MAACGAHARDDELETEARIRAEPSPVQFLHHRHRQRGLTHVARSGHCSDLEDLFGCLALVADSRLSGTGRRDYTLRVLDDGQPAGLKLPPSGTVGVFRDALSDPLEVGFQFGLADGLLGDIALPAK